jgi:predicted alpha/beta superfamily hydrolase
MNNNQKPSPRHMPVPVKARIYATKKGLRLKAIFSPATIVCFALLLGWHIAAFSQNSQPAAHAAVEIPGSQIRKLTSSIVAGQEYELHISLPGNYNRDTDKTYPVVFVLDGQWDWPLVASIYGSQYFDGFIPGIIVVGIQWGGVNPNPDRLRARDFTPIQVGNQETGNAPKFLSFIKNELVPFMESNYRVKKNDRTLIGSSLGGLFTLYAMFHETAFFQRYVLTSPAIGYGSEVTYKYEKEYADKKIPLPVKLYMAHGELEGGVPGFERFVNVMKSRNYQGLDMQTRILEGSGHSGTKAEGYTRGLQHVFAKPDLKLADAVLDQYTGSYLAGSDTVRMVKEAGQLVGLPRGNRRIVLKAETENNFYTKGSFLYIRFRKDAAGKVEGFQLETYGNSLFAKRIQ